MAWSKGNKKSWRNDVSRAKVLLEYFRGKTFAQISPLAVEKFKSERRKSTVEFKEKPGRTRSLASVKRELELLSRLFTLAIQRRLTDTNPCGEVRKFDLDNRRRLHLLDERAANPTYPFMPRMTFMDYGKITASVLPAFPVG